MVNHRLFEREEQTIWPSSPLIEEAPELPSSPTTLFSGGPLYPLSRKCLSNTVRFDDHFDCTDVTLPKYDHESDTHSPSEERIPLQFSESIFEETLSEDETEGAGTSDDDDDDSMSTFFPAAPEFLIVGFTGDLPPSRAKGRTTPSRGLHCRICPKDFCDDLTATMCGHLFCNRCVELIDKCVIVFNANLLFVVHSCITEAIVATPRCPVCSAPTLLYCLFRLDLQA